MLCKILVAYCKSNRVIGKNGGLPWGRLKGDLPRFKAMTTGNIVIMGRKTWESIGSKPLPNRKNFVISRTLPKVEIPSEDGPFIHPSLEIGMKAAGGWGKTKDIFIIGGEQIYAEALRLDVVEAIIASEVNDTYDGDAFFPVLDDKWKSYSFELFEEYCVNIYRKKCVL